jgi:hypothetical protein
MQTTMSNNPKNTIRAKAMAQRKLMKAAGGDWKPTGGDKKHIAMQMRAAKMKS